MSLPAQRGPVTLILGGARSGKSRFAESLALETGLAPVYVATASVHDEEMRARVHDHQTRRDTRWRTVEVLLDLAGAIEAEATPKRIVLVDCLTLWLTNVMLGGGDVPEAAEELAATLAWIPGPVILVSNEVGFGIVPDNALARAFRDHQGRLNQRLAAVADRVTLVAAGLPLDLKLPKESAR
ncbi:bifunctional adenosylcobinamide kinase/adenosylcobinamide-phosphate guanylyltransferase [Methylopila sp. M107]|uniref:bifunctional adenosylcobinamide kinase/adenosylcobinamide-phosphate guanylyltransferase n=1 Tax=Methylopila sp. M107 TaxID=1101190 RepID=UPI00037F6D83|nr:bifunctional adenosylcobinamide kinase/adenosylcobinamide-phosphate guanylyltransferase [Methylopila sp. M107]